MSDYPKIPEHLSTPHCGNRVGRWKARRAIIIDQRAIFLRELREVMPLGFISGMQRVKNGLVGRIDTLNKRLDECNEAIDSLTANMTRTTVSKIVGRAPRKRRAS